MSRYIDADAVENTLQQMEMITAMSNIELGEENDDIGEISMPIFTVRNIMNTAPSIDIEPKRGEWTRTFDGNEWFWYCSNCKSQWYEEDLWMGGNEFPNFCPNCGADMREREGE